MRGPDHRAIALRYLNDPHAGVAELASIFGVSAKVVERSLREELVPVRRPRSATEGWDEADVDLVRLMIEAGWDRYRVAARFGVTTSVLRAVVAGAGEPFSRLFPVSRASGGGRRPDRRRGPVLDACLSGRLTVDGAAAEFDVSAETVVRWLREAGLNPVRRARPPHPHRAAAIERFRRGDVDTSWLAAEFGVSRTTIYNWLRQAGLGPA